MSLKDCFHDQEKGFRIKQLFVTIQQPDKRLSEMENWKKN